MNAAERQRIERGQRLADRLFELEERAKRAELEAAHWQRATRTAEIDTENAEAQLRVMRRKVKELEKKIEGGTGKAEDRQAEVQELFDFWKTACRHDRAKLGAKRAQAVRGALNLGYTVDDLKEAISGASVDAFEKDGKRFDDLELICRNEVKIDRFRASWRAHQEALQRALTLIQRIDVRCGPGEVDPRMGWTLYGCPVCRFDQEGGYKSLRVAHDGEIVECSACGADLPAVEKALAG